MDCPYKEDRLAKTKRRELRVSSREDDLLVEASSLLGVSVTEFLLSKAVADAEKVVDAHRTILLQADAYQRFLDVLDAPASPANELIKQIRKSRSLKHIN